MSEFSVLGAVLTVVLTLTGGAIGLRGSAWLQERDQARRQRNTAMALREDLRRICAALGAPGIAGVPSLEVGSEPDVLRVHPWVEGLITDLASADPEVVRRFLALQHDLQKRDLRLATYLEAARQEDFTLRNRDRYRGLAAQKDASEVLYLNEAARAETDRPAHEAARVVQETQFVDADRVLRENLAHLSSLLDKLIARPMPSIIPDPPSAD